MPAEGGDVRGLTTGIENPNPIVTSLPAILQEDDFTTRLTAGLDDVVAPVFWLLDNLAAYLDPDTAPLDFLEYLGGWLGVALDETWPEARQRALVRRTIDLYQWRGTPRGLSLLVELYTGVTPEIEESGGTSFSPVPAGELPGTSTPSLVVRIRVADPTSIDATRLDRLVAEAKPAHIPHTIEVLAA